ncbi:MAG: hypothetical protein F6J87_31050 [Spirulina sp. SIO3F2]|nr:hypothetical protein [Spirulina sp. SIO3F2]
MNLEPYSLIYQVRCFLGLQDPRPYHKIIQRLIPDAVEINQSDEEAQIEYSFSLGFLSTFEVHFFLFNGVFSYSGEVEQLEEILTVLALVLKSLIDILPSLKA